MVHVDALRSDQADGAVLNRLTRLARRERLELRGTHDPHSLWLWLQQRDPGGHSWEATQDDLGGWSVHVMRRATT